MAVRIITDSTVDIGSKYSDQFTVVPLTVSFGEQDFIDGVTLSKHEFYEKLADERLKLWHYSPVMLGEMFVEAERTGVIPYPEEA